MRRKKGLRYSIRGIQSDENQCLPATSKILISEDWYWILRSDPCWVCGKQSSAIDHIQPRHGGGGNHWSNLSGMCKSCNSRKRNRSLLSFLYRLSPAGQFLKEKRNRYQELYRLTADIGSHYE